jgi:TonB family protein
MAKFCNILLLLVSVLAIFSTPSQAQNPVTISAPAVDAAIATQNRVTYVDPIYPAIAKAAHVTGTVVLQLEVEPDGSVGKVKTISGPQMLNGAATDAVKQWHYKPFMQGGSPAAVSTTVSIPFALGTQPADNDSAIQSTFFPLSDACHKAVAQNTSPAEQADTCRRAAEIADQFAHDSRFIERRSAYVYASTALLRNRELEEALRFAEKAVAVAQQGNDDDSGRAAVFSVRAQAKAALGDLVGSDQDLTRAENEQRAAIDGPAGHELHKEYTHVLIGLLRFHAQLLQAMDKPAEEQAKLDEAAKLQ